jgi:hypothetical protein
MRFHAVGLALFLASRAYAGGDLCHAEAGILKVELVLTPEEFDAFRELLGRDVVATGKLVSALSGHHHAKVLLDVVDLRQPERP